METVPHRGAWVTAELDRLVDEYRLSCLWYLRTDFYPHTDAERARVLRAIADHGDLSAFRRARRLLQWLSLPFSEASAGSSQRHA